MSTDQNSINHLVIISGSFAFVGGLAWNEAFESLFDKYLGTRNAIITTGN